MTSQTEKARLDALRNQICANFYREEAERKKIREEFQARRKEEEEADGTAAQRRAWETYRAAHRVECTSTRGETWGT